MKYITLTWFISLSQVKSSQVKSHYLYSAFHNTDCIKAASQ